MSYAVKEIFYTLQGEGANAGRPAVFCRFAGCNLWSGREQDRAGAVCRFCDTDFVGTDGVGGGKFESASALAAAIAAHWPAAAGGKPLVVFSGGEPLLQLDAALVEAAHAQGFTLAVETNGTQPAPPGLDWLCVSPKAGAPLVLTVNGRAEVVVQDAAAYQRLLERAARADMAETVTAIQQGLADAVAGRVKPARQALETLARKYGISDKET